MNLKSSFFVAVVVLLATEAAIAGFGTEVLITPTTGAVTKEFRMPAGHASSLMLVGALSGAEEITIERCVTYDSGGACTTWEPLEIDGSVVTGLTDTNHVVTFYGGIEGRLNKPTTAAAAGVRWVK